MDNGTTWSALKADRINSGQKMVVDILKQLRVDKTERSLNYSEDHVWIFMFAFEKENDVDDVVHNICYLLAIFWSLKHLLLPLYFFFLNNLYEGNDLCENAQNIHV